MKKAFLLGAGLGTRLRPMTNTVPKPLVPVFHRPMATYALDHLLAAGISEVAINTHHLHEEWERTFPGRTYRGMNLHFFHEEILLETGGGIKNIASFIGDDPLIVYNGDILTNIAIDQLIDQHEASSSIATLAVRSNGPACHLAVQNGLVTDIRNKLGISEGSHQFTGIYCISPEILSLIPADEKISIIPAFLELAKKGKLAAFGADQGHWLDLGTRDAYLETHGIGAELETGHHLSPLHAEATIDPSAAITNSWVGPGCLVEAGAELTNCLLWPNTTVAAQAKLSNCIVHSPLPITGTHQDKDL